MSFTFDGPNKIISLGLGTSAIDIRLLWSRAMDWWLTGDNSKFQFPFRQVGGDTIDSSAGTSIPFYFYLVGGWRIRPQEANHSLSVTGGVLLVEGGGDPFLNTVGNFTVRVNYSQPVQAITVSTGGGSSGASPQEIASSVRTELSPELAVILSNLDGKISKLLTKGQFLGLK